MVAVALAIGTAILYAPAGHHGFVNYDDADYAYDNPHVTAGLSAEAARWAFTTGFAANYHPLTWISLAADASRASPNDLAATMHWTNIALHAANVALLFLLLAVATGTDAPAAAVAVLFAVHPVHVESVAWVAERKDVLCGLFYLSAMVAHVAIRSRGWRVVATTLLGAAALLSKPMAVSLPVALLLVDYWPLRRVTTRAVVDQLPLLALSAAFCWVTVAVQSAGGAVQSLADVPLAARAQNVPAAYARYLGKLAWPSGLSVFYPYHAALPPMAVAASVALLVGVTAIALWAGRRVPYVAFGWLWFGVTLGPVIGIVQVGYQSLADRYLYLPLIGPAVIVVWGVRDLLGRARAVGWAIAAGVAAVLAVATYRQLAYWTDTRTLFNRSLAVAPDNPVAEAQLGWLDRTEGNLPSAEAHYARAVQLLARYGDAAFNLGNLLLPKDPAAALRCYELALRSMPDDPRVLNNLRYAQAVVHLQAAIIARPRDADPHVDLGQLLLNYGQRESAAKEFAAALAIDPGSARARQGLAMARGGESRR
jgi:tetratricopeptide (TPR) repeat protein